MAEIPTRTISQFKSKLTGGGARPNLFEVQVNFPAGVSLGIQGDGGPTEFDGDNFRFMCKAAALPASNVASIDVPFRGRTFKVAGDRTIDNWTITVINDENFAVRNAMERWSQSIIDNATNQGQVDPNNYMSQADVFQYSRQKGNGDNVGVIKTYRFIDIFPVTVGDIALSYDSGDTIEEFDVEFAVNNIELVGLNGGGQAGEEQTVTSG